MPDILRDIIRKKEADYRRMGPAFGTEVPARRVRAVVPFLQEDGTILEIKRRSPSRGDIAASLNVAEVARAYGKAGTQAISVLTERNFFSGSLDDLMTASAACPALSYLRKDFILHGDEIETSYRCGADAVLLIARVLDDALLLRLAELVRDHGMTPFIEVRTADDIRKLRLAAASGPVLAGTNSRDLTSFSIDLLRPASMRPLLPCRAVFESGILTPLSARYAREIGYEGLLMGEAAVREPDKAAAFVQEFTGASPCNANGRFWRAVSELAVGKTEAAGPGATSRPLVKICGLTRAADALEAALQGADILGCVMVGTSPRRADGKQVRAVREAIGSLHPRPLLVAVVTDIRSPEGRQAVELARGGIVDALQIHMPDPGKAAATLQDIPRDIAWYPACGCASPEEAARLPAVMGYGSPRVLVDASTEGTSGGTGRCVDGKTITEAHHHAPLWLAGGLNPENVAEVIARHRPELIDASSGLERNPGRKDGGKLAAFFQEILKTASMRSI